jgi:hypothetical protein
VGTSTAEPGGAIELTAGRVSAIQQERRRGGRRQARRPGGEGRMESREGRT